MKHILRALPTMLSASFAHMVQYRGEIVLWAVWGIVFPAVSMAAWGAAAGSSGGLVGDFSRGEIVAYFLLTMIIGHATAAWDVYEMGYLVRTGELSPRLLRPMLPVWQGIADNTAYKVLTLTILIPIWIGVAWYAQPDFSRAHWYHVALGIPSTALAAGIAFVWGYCIATMAFYITKMDAASEFYFGLSLFLGGRFAAMDWLPTPLYLMTYLVPFRWMLAFPAELTMGRLPAATIATGFAWQIGWLVAGVVVFRYAWALGVKRYSAVGA
jgi:ABC-2 type transport system permease protein